MDLVKIKSKNQAKGYRQTPGPEVEVSQQMPAGQDIGGNQIYFS
jgi:hypothetical protein